MDLFKDTDLEVISSKQKYKQNITVNFTQKLILSTMQLISMNDVIKVSTSIVLYFVIESSTLSYYN